MRTTFRSLLESGRKFTGCYVTFHCDAAVEILRYAGVDFLIFDMEHERLTFTEIMPMLMAADACGMATMLRVASIDPSVIARALDLGVSAMKVPGVSTAEEARRVVAACKYPPEGERGACSFVRGNGYGFLDGKKCFSRANREVVVSVIIEGEEGLQNMEEIIAVPGVDVVSVGRSDLCVALGVPGEPNHPKVRQAVEESVRLCEKHGKTCSIQTAGASDAAQYKNAKGVSHFILRNPAVMLYQAYQPLCAEIDAALGQAAR